MGGVRNIIVEGPDGSGKSTLIRELSQDLGFPVARRAVTSLEGPIMSLVDWHNDELVRMTALNSQPMIYDRHPLISEPIYAPLVRNVPPQSPFGDQEWLDLNRHNVSRMALLVVCLPPQWVVKSNAQRTAQMPGVTENIVKVWNAYASIGRLNWWPPNRTVWYDYTSHDQAPFRKLLIKNALRGVTRV